MSEQVPVAPPVSADEIDTERLQAQTDRMQEVLARGQAEFVPTVLTGFEDAETRLLIEAKNFLRRGKVYSLRPLLPLLLNLKGKPYSLRNYFPFEPFFRTRMPKKLVMRCGRQLAKTLSCTSSSKVYLVNGRRVAGPDLKIGDRVMSVDKHLRTTPGTVVDVINHPGKPVLRVTTRMGAVIDLADTHPLRCLRGWVCGTDLRVGDRVAVIRRGGCFGSEKIPEARIVLTAYLLGDGALKGNLHVTNVCAQVKQECVRYAEPLQHIPVRLHRENICFSRARDGVLMGWLRQDDLLEKNAWEKHIPDWVFSLSRANTALFLSRLWATDGMIKRAKNTLHICYASTSRELAYGVKALLTKFGIPSTIKRTKTGYRQKNGVRKRCRDAYVLRVETRDGWRRFMAAFSVPGKPSVPLPTGRENNNRDTVPIEVHDWLIELAEATRHRNKDSLRTFSLRVKPKYPLSRKKLRAYVCYFSRTNPQHPRLQDLKDLLTGDVMWDEVVAVAPLGTQPCWDIEVESEHNYVVDGVLSHNSTSLAAQGIIVSNSIPYFATLYVTPLFEMVRRFSHNYVREFIENSPVRKLFIASTTTNQILQRSFLNGSSMYFSYALLDANRTRGLACDRLAIDEVGEMSYDLLEIIEETLSGSPWGLQQFTGTPKSLDNCIAKLSEDSSQAEWVIRCQQPGCRHWNVPALSHDLYDMIGPWHRDISEASPGVVCAKCRKPINPRTGRWVHAYPERRWKFAGYHIPQIIMPMHYASAEKWDTLVGKMLGRNNTTPTAFLNEVCGESCDAGAKLVTETDLKAAAILPWPNKAQEAAKHINRYKLRVLAVDWGGGGGRLRGGATKGGEEQRLRTSFTSLAALGITPDGKVDVLWGHRSLRTHDWEYEARLAIEALSLFRCVHIAHDFSNAGEGRLGYLYNAGLPTRSALNTCYHGAGQAKSYMKYYPATTDNPHAWYSLNRALSLAKTCQCIKYGLIRFFQYDYVNAGDAGLLRDFLALIEEKIEAFRGTDVYQIVRNPNMPDDFAHAVNIGANHLWAMTKQWPDVAEAAKFSIPDHVLQAVYPSVPVAWDDI